MYKPKNYGNGLYKPKNMNTNDDHGIGFLYREWVLEAVFWRPLNEETRDKTQDTDNIQLINHKEKFLRLNIGSCDFFVSCTLFLASSSLDSMRSNRSRCLTMPVDTPYSSATLSNSH